MFDEIDWFSRLEGCPWCDGPAEVVDIVVIDVRDDVGRVTRGRSLELSYK